MVVQDRAGSWFRQEVQHMAGCLFQECCCSHMVLVVPYPWQLIRPVLQLLGRTGGVAATPC